ncbi:ANR family transcriptional regulator [Serratia ficaria]|uniref:ANR family transcriptional regulator n=1 Tax=Serratia ficaria TaxID=61651 RepID=UPI00077C1F81|nr:ANR family transcriptional regulator [Serratia ficaria]
MTPEYLNLAQQAAEAERRAHYSDAASIWVKSLKFARAVDVAWVGVRIDFCFSATANSWGR